MTTIAFFNNKGGVGKTTLGVPIFHLKAADGALGGHIYAVQECHDDFRASRPKSPPSAAFRYSRAPVASLRRYV